MGNLHVYFIMGLCFSCSTILHLVYYFVSFSETWEEYLLPLMETALGAGLLDFIDFHAYDTDATAQVSTVSANGTALVCVYRGRSTTDTLMQ